MWASRSRRPRADRRLRALEDLAQGVRRLSDALTEHIGEGAMTADTLLDEQKLQLTLARHGRARQRRRPARTAA